MAILDPTVAFTWVNVQNIKILSALALSIVGSSIGGSMFVLLIPF